MKISQSVIYENWLKACVSCFKGNVRKSMEDRFLISDFSLNTKHYYIFGVFDGHNGSEAVDLVCDELIDTLKYFIRRQIDEKEQKKRSTMDICLCIDNTFELINNKCKSFPEVGTTISFLLIVHDTIKDKLKKYIANVGDSTIYGVKSASNSVRKISFDHKPNVKKELDRVQQFDNFAGYDGSYVLFNDSKSNTSKNSGLAMTRAIGDIEMGEAISCKPYIRKMKTGYDVVMIASDGIWDVMDGRKVWSKLKQDILVNKESWKDSAESLNNYRNKMYDQHDNTCFMLVFIDK